MIKLKYLMLYCERVYTDKDVSKPSIEDNLFILPDKLANEITSYLADEKYVLLEFVSPIIDPYNKKDSIPTVLYSDGMYVWDSIIIHWIYKYRVRLPDEFLIYFNQLISKKFLPIILDKECLLEQVNGNGDYEEIFV